MFLCPGDADVVSHFNFSLLLEASASDHHRPLAAAAGTDVTGNAIKRCWSDAAPWWTRWNCN